MKEVLESTRGCVAPLLKDTKETTQLIKKLKRYGIMNDDAPAGPGAVSGPPAQAPPAGIQSTSAPAPLESDQGQKPAVQPAHQTTGGSAKSAGTSESSRSDSSSAQVAAVLFGAAAVAA